MIETIKKNTKRAGLDNIFTTINLNYFLVGFSVVVGFYLNWQPLNIFMFSFILFVILVPTDSKITAKLAILSLSLLPFLMIIKKTVIAEQISILAFFFLFITLVLEILSYRKNH